MGLPKLLAVLTVACVLAAAYYGAALKPTVMEAGQVQPTHEDRVAREIAETERAFGD